MSFLKRMKGMNSWEVLFLHQGVSRIKLFCFRSWTLLYRAPILLFILSTKRNFNIETDKEGVEGTPLVKEYRQRLAIAGAYGRGDFTSSQQWYDMISDGSAGADQGILIATGPLS